MQRTANSPGLSLSSLIDVSSATSPSLTSSTFSLAIADHHVPFSAQVESSIASSPSSSVAPRNDALPSACLTTLVPRDDEAVGAISEVRPFARCGCGTCTNDEFEADVVVPSLEEDELAPLSLGGTDDVGAVDPGDKLM